MKSFIRSESFFGMALTLAGLVLLSTDTSLENFALLNQSKRTTVEAASSTGQIVGWLTLFQGFLILAPAAWFQGLEKPPAFVSVLAVTSFQHDNLESRRRPESRGEHATLAKNAACRRSIDANIGGATVRRVGSSLGLKKKRGPGRVNVSVPLSDVDIVDTIPDTTGVQVDRFQTNP